MGLPFWGAFLILGLVAHEGLHGEGVNLLALGFPVITHDFGLVFVGDGEF